MLKGARIDSLRYIDCYGLNPIAKGTTERKEGTDGIVYGDGYPQEDYFELAQVYTPVYIEDGKLKIENGPADENNAQPNLQSSIFNLTWRTASTSSPYMAIVFAGS